MGHFCTIWGPGQITGALLFVTNSITYLPVRKSEKVKFLLRKVMKEIKDAEFENIIIDCSIDILEEVLKQAQQVGIMSEKNKIIVTSLVITNQFPSFSFVRDTRNFLEILPNFPISGSPNDRSRTVPIFRGEFHGGAFNRSRLCQRVEYREDARSGMGFGQSPSIKGRARAYVRRRATFRQGLQTVEGQHRG